MPPKTGRPPIGPTVKTSLGSTWIERLNAVTAKMATFTKAFRNARGAGSSLATSEDRAWDRSAVIATLIQAGLGQFAETVLGEKNAVKLGDPCPLCWGHVDGPHAPKCGYFGPLSEYDSHRDDRIRGVLFRSGIASHFRNVDGKVAEIFDLEAAPPDPAT